MDLNLNLVINRTLTFLLLLFLYKVRYWKLNKYMECNSEALSFTINAEMSLILMQVVCGSYLKKCCSNVHLAKKQ